jgi:hypothetical protein
MAANSICCIIFAGKITFILSFSVKPASASRVQTISLFRDFVTLFFSESGSNYRTYSIICPVFIFVSEPLCAVEHIVSRMYYTITEFSANQNVVRQVRAQEHLFATLSLEVGSHLGRPWSACSS